MAVCKGVSLNVFPVIVYKIRVGYTLLKIKIKVAVANSLYAILPAIVNPSCPIPLQERESERERERERERQRERGGERGRE